MSAFNRYLFAALLLGLVAVTVVGIVRIGEMVRPRIIAHVTTPDGVEMGLTQRCNFSAEPFTTSFVYRRPGDVWRWFYYDHQDDFWNNSRVVLNADKQIAVFYRDDQPAVTFDWAKEDYTLHRRRGTDHQGNPMDAGWSPEAFLRGR